MTIVIAWTTTHRVAIDFETTRIDLGERPTMEDRRRGHAAIWLNVGTTEDLTKAKAHAETLDEPAYVYTFTTATENPLSRAKALALAEPC